MNDLHWIDETAEFTLADQERVLGRVKCETREVSPGVWEHTFTPQRTINLADLIHGETTASTGSLSLADIDAILEQCRVNDPGMIFISVETMRQIRHVERIGQLYRAHPIPRRKIRKCYLRKLQERWRVGREHIRRVERAERMREPA